VGYGSAGAVRAVEQLRLVMAEMQVATVRSQVMLSLRDDFENYSVFKPRDHQKKALDQVFDQVVAWSGALRGLREKRA
jgi:NAD(P)H-dependent FMN reductase